MKPLKKKLLDICNPKQWKTISMSELKSAGYSVYGANGKIGYYDSYTHTKETILITCRGATCGTINICEPYSYVTGNSMALDDLEEELVDLQFLRHQLKARGFSDVISGSAQPQITRQGLSKIEVLLPALEIQKEISKKINKSEFLIEKRRQSNQKLDQLVQSIFIDMFGDPLTNNKKWATEKLGSIAEIKTGNTPPRSIDSYYGDYIEWIKSDNLNTPFFYATKAEEFLSEEGLALARKVEAGSILVTCIAGSKECIGNAAIVDREVTFNQQINSITCREKIISEFMYGQILAGKKLIQAASTNSMKGMVSKSNFENIKFIVPPLELQKKFRERFLKINQIRNQAFQSERHLLELQQSLSHKFFNE